MKLELVNCKNCGNYDEKENMYQLETNRFYCVNCVDICKRCGGAERGINNHKGYCYECLEYVDMYGEYN